MKTRGKSLAKRIETRIARKRVNVFLRSDFQDLGGYDQVGRSLRSLTAKGRLVRIGYGVYARTTLSPVSRKPIPAQPLPALATEALARLGIEMAPSSFAQAYNAGTTTQVPTGRAIAIKGRFSRKIGCYGTYAVFERASRS